MKVFLSHKMSGLEEKAVMRIRYRALSVASLAKAFAVRTPERLLSIS